MVAEGGYKKSTTVSARPARARSSRHCLSLSMSTAGRLNDEKGRACFRGHETGRAVRNWPAREGAILKHCAKNKRCASFGLGAGMEVGYGEHRCCNRCPLNPALANSHSRQFTAPARDRMANRWRKAARRAHEKLHAPLQRALESTAISPKLPIRRRITPTHRSD